MVSGAKVFKLILLGNGAVGKSSLLKRFEDDGYSKVYKQTVGLDFCEKKVSLKGKEITLQVIDIGGQSVGSKMLTKYIYGCDVAFLCYDVTDSASFRDVSEWKSLVHRSWEEVALHMRDKRIKSVQSRKLPPQLYLVGNKIDLPQQLRRVTEDEHKTYARKERFTGQFFASARSGENVAKLFNIVVFKLLGVRLEPYELDLLEKVLTVNVASCKQDAVVLKGMTEIEKEDLKYGTTLADLIEKEEARETAKRRKWCCIC